ncbi:ACR266Wp [Eremothecium gossypii ATCC 10895]|uniref:Protein BZZ1 n=1 Tax=Eremothecium gossypii (strain ATCC 10895 / CBS 109.51 / FGSC 9923 / NRRL Y-1056) TaxID=284811 RepID=Q75BK5_EREGS|nr:ACR266Wp [Eremothecium gossypii ATCC 10895]AAS51492.2 ACR266Wp [Eremothecium gossypii ATCC 10895]AEY95784.1 FACR266Wp [Eremothecium gossypii FDAG1]
MSNISIGNDLKDSYTETRKWVIGNTKWLQDLASFYHERSKLEREYGEKLAGLTKEYFGRKSNSTVVLSVGETPTITPGSLESASQVAWNEVLSQTENVAKDHKRLAKEMQTQVADQLASLEKRCDLILNTIDGFNHELVNKRDYAYSCLEKAKKRYDESCQAMEAARQKQSKSGSSSKAQRKVDEKEHEMNIAKNDYLIQINQTNRLKDKYYFQDVPEALDLLQDLNESRIRVLNSIWRRASDLEREAHKKIDERLSAADDVVGQNYPHLDTSMFIKHNFREWKEPDDYQYVPSPVWHDDETFSVPSDVELHDLKIRLAKAQNSYNRLQLVVHDEMSTLTQLNKKKQEMKLNAAVDPYEFQELLKKYLATVSSFTTHETSKLEAEVEIESIQNNVGDSHDLSKEGLDISRRFKKSSMFGMFKRATAPRSTGANDDISEMSVDVASKSSPKHHGLSLFRSKRIRAQSTESSGMQSSTMDDSSSMMSISNEEHKGGNRVLFPYTKQDEDEVTIAPGNSIVLLRQDDGSGWVKIRNASTQQEGLVPSTYVEINEHHSIGKPVPRAPPPRKGAAPLKTVTAIYDYSAQDDDEISIRAGDVIKVLRGDTGNGWTYGEVNGSKGLFPSNYCN